MIKLDNMPIRRKLKLVILVTCVLVVVLASVGFFSYEQISYRGIMENTIESTADIVAENSNAALAFQDSRDAAKVLKSLSSQPHVLSAAIYDSQGNLFAIYRKNGTSAVIPSSAPFVGSTLGNGAMTLTREIIAGGEPIGRLYLRMDLQEQRRRLWSYLDIAILVLLFSLTAAYLLANALAKTISAPIMNLSDTAHRVAKEKTYSIRATRETNDETGLLAEAFNEMLEEIERREKELASYRGHLEELVERRTSELALANENLGLANKELESFSYSVSHDLRAPLRHISGFVDLLRKHAEGALDEKSRRFLQTISSSTSTMGTLIDELLVFSRMGRSEMRATMVSSEDIVRDAIASLDQETAGRAVHWHVGRLPAVKADPSMLRLVYVNLLSNAVKYTSKTAEAEIYVGCDRVDGEDRFFVKDNGVGFDMKYADKLFGVFQRLHRQEEFEWVGIGLANVRRIIQRHGGRTWAESELNKGATFYFTLPNLEGERLNERVEEDTAGGR